MFRLLLLLALLVASVQTVFACDVPEGWLQMKPNEEASHILWIQPDDGAYRQGQRFGADIIVCKNDVKTLVKGIAIDAIMPAHRHGMNYLAELLHDEHMTQLRASGLFFHMPGEWQITVTLGLSAKTERHNLTLIVK